MISQYSFLKYILSVQEKQALLPSKTNLEVKSLCYLQHNITQLQNCIRNLK